MSKTDSNALLLAALSGQPLPRMPIWVMRQAGRYLPEYRKSRKQAGSFLKLCKTPKLASEVTLQPIERFELDAAIIFSDILIVPDAMGLSLGFVENEGPQLANPLQTAKDIAALPIAKASDLTYLAEALELTRAELPSSVALIGFAGAPFTLACYMTQGHGGGEFLIARKMIYSEPKLFTELLAKLVQSVVVNLAMQAQAGADVLMLFDSWAMQVPFQAGRMCIIEPIAAVIKLLRQQGINQPIIVFARGVPQYASELVAAGANCLGVSWQNDLAALRKQLGETIALQGNLDPAVLLSDSATIKQAASAVVKAHGNGRSGKIFNLGHGIDKQTPPENVAHLIKAVREASQVG